jgi:hypothetical protein
MATTDHIFKDSERIRMGRSASRALATMIALYFFKLNEELDGLAVSALSVRSPKSSNIGQSLKG